MMATAMVHLHRLTVKVAVMLCSIVREQCGFASTVLLTARLCLEVVPDCLPCQTQSQRTRIQPQKCCQWASRVAPHPWLLGPAVSLHTSTWLSCCPSFLSCIRYVDIVKLHFYNLSTQHGHCQPALSAKTGYQLCMLSSIFSPCLQSDKQLRSLSQVAGCMLNNVTIDAVRCLRKTIANVGSC